MRLSDIAYSRPQSLTGPGRVNGSVARVVAPAGPGARVPPLLCRLTAPPGTDLSLICTGRCDICRDAFYGLRLFKTR